MFYSKKEIIGRVNRCLTGQAHDDEYNEIAAYGMDEELYFWMMYGIGSAVVAGTVSREFAKRARERAGVVFRGLAAKLYFLKKIGVSRKSCWSKRHEGMMKVYSALAKRDPEGLADAVMSVLAAGEDDQPLEAIYREAVSDPDFKKKWVDTLWENEEKITEMFGDSIHCESYLPLIEKFYAGCVEDGSAEMFNGFGESAPRLEDVMPEKAEELETFRNNLRKVYGVEKRYV